MEDNIFQPAVNFLPGDLIGVIDDFSPSPVEVSLAVDLTSITENSGKSIKYTFTRTGDTTNALTVNFSIAGKAQLNTDYKLDGILDDTEGTVTIAAGETTADVTITPVADSVIESDEAVKLTLAAGSNYIFDADASGMAMSAMANDDPMLDAAWAKKFTSSGYGYKFLTVDDEGNTYVTGDFTDSVTLGNDILRAVSGRDIFVAKLNKDGNFQWAEDFNKGRNENVRDITLDDEGNTYIAGRFEASEGGNVFINKYSKDGTFLWEKNFGDNSTNAEISGIKVDAEGNTYLTGDFGLQLTFPTTPDATTLDADFQRDAFVAKLDNNGDALWAKKYGSDLLVGEAEDIVVDFEGNAYLFMTEDNEGEDSAVITKLDKSDGSEVWQETFGDFTNDVVAGNIAIDNQDNIFIAGEFEGEVSFGNTNLESEDGDIFIAKLDSEGDVVWAKDFDSGEDDNVEVEGIAVDDMGNTYVSGYYQSESMSVGNFMLYDEGGEKGFLGEDAFIAKFDSQGEVKWAQNIGGMNAETITDIAVNDGKIHIAGKFYKEATFADKSLTIKNLDLTDTFLVKLEEGEETEEEEKPEISLAVDSNNIAEGGNNQITYTFTRKGDNTAELTVDFSVSGSATFNQDYTLTGADDGFDGSKGKITFKAGESTATVVLNIINDENIEADETLAFNLAMGSGYMLSATETETKSNITITSDDVETIIEETEETPDSIPDDEGELSFTSNANNTFKFKSKIKGGKSSVKFSVKNKTIDEIKEIGFFAVDDDEGNIGEFSPKDEGYIEAALNRAQSILSVIGNAPQGFDLTQVDKVVEFSSDKSFRFLSVKDGTIDGALQGKVNLLQVAFSSEVSQLESNSFDLDFAGVKIAMKVDSEAKKAFGSGLQDKIEVLDLREATTTQAVTFTVNREADFDNTIGFYQVLDEDGGIDTNGDGTVDILVGDAGYAQAAVQNRIASIDLSVGNQETATFNGEFEGGGIVVPFLIVDGNLDAFEEVYFPYIDANSDGADHIMMLGDNSFGFEDLAQGGDRDFNDIIAKVDFINVST